ncbi:MAG: peptidase S10 [Burkholderiales bacterium]|nr:peptidase S10 [Burkholderiales bacterium]
MKRTYGMGTMLLALCCALAACGGGGGGSGGSSQAGGGTPVSAAGDVAYTDSANYSGNAGDSLASAQEGAAITHHQITLASGTLNYTATAGHLTASNPQTGAPEATFFYVAYTRDNQSAAQRPVTFFYNGGPGSASVWLHLGSFGPKRLVTGDPSSSPVTPFPLVDNQQTLLDTSDLVFVDAIGTGLSEAIAPNTNQTFWGVDADAAAFRDFISRYLTVNQRLASPKFLFGESYGTLRSAVLSNLMESAAMHLNGVVLQSSILNYNSNCGVVTQPISCAGYLPTYGTVGAYYQLDNPNPADLPSFAQQMRGFTTGTYSPAVNAYLSNRTSASPALINQLVSYTGASTALWTGDLNLDPGTFQYNLVPNTMIGRYDARVSAPNGSALTQDGDPSSTVISAQFGNTIVSYLSGTLKYANNSVYTMLGNQIDSWVWTHDGQQLPDSVPDIATALTLNPKLKYLSLNGYHDLATPFFQTEQDLARLGSTANVTVTHYNGGHMTYLDDGSRPLERADLGAFYQAALSAK